MYYRVFFGKKLEQQKCLSSKIVITTILSSLKPYLEGDSVASSLPFSVVVVPILIPSRCLKRSAKDLGLKVVVVLVGIGARVLMLNKLILVVVGGSCVTVSSFK